jgi:hypothetical protein
MVIWRGSNRRVPIQEVDIVALLEAHRSEKKFLRIRHVL